VIPQGRIAEVLELAHDKVTRENHTRRELEEGSSLRDVFNKYGVL
jgi:4-hydroxy-4-methyl-2-oxoglutarate aldolase